MSDAVEIALIVSIAPTLTAIIGIIAILKKIEVVRNDVNSKMSELVRTTGEAEKAKGNLEGRAQLKEEQK